jgi:hypothetical protein
MMSMGHKYILISVSLTKHALQMEMPNEMRLRFLEYLEKFTDNVLTPAVIAMVEPIDEKGLELWNEIKKLGYGMSPPNVFDALYRKFDVFAALNPSLQAAYDEACRPWRRSA